MMDRTSVGGFLGVPIGLVLGAVVGGVVGGSCVQGNIFVRLIAALIGAVTCAAVAAFVGIYIGDYLGGRLVAQKAAEVIRRRPSLIEPYYRRAIAYLVLHEFDRVIADCTHVIKTDRTPVSREEPVPPFVADAYVHRGAAFAGLGHHDKAIADFTNAMELAPDVPTPYQWRAQSYRAMGEAKRAAEDERKARFG